MIKKENITKGFIDFAKLNYDELGKTEKAPYKKFSMILSNVRTHFKYDSHFKRLDDIEQSWKTIMGHVLEGLIEYSLQKELAKINLKCKKPTKFEMGFNYKEMENQLLVNVGGVMILPDVDRVIYQDNPFKIIAVLSIKKKFRERIAQVGYWTIQLRGAKKDIKNIMVTTDENGTFSKEKHRSEKVKAKAIAKEHTNGTFVATEAEIEENGNVKKFDKLIKFLQDLKENPNKTT